jgi:hypothetical protein
MTAHMLGSAAFEVNPDPIHINQITAAVLDSPYWQRNDLLISARHTSTVYLYRPSTDKIIWHQQGPWLNQHSAHFSSKNTIAVFGNDVYGSVKEPLFLYSEGHNQIYQYDFKTTQIQKLHAKFLNDIKPRTFTEGRSRVLNDGSIFVEETNNARLFKLSPTGQLIWSYINTYDSENLGVVSWSRYLTGEEINATIDLKNMTCNGT